MLIGDGYKANPYQEYVPPLRRCSKQTLLLPIPHTHTELSMSAHKYLTPEPVRYDPAIDPNNMSQYAPKDYRAVPVYEKVCNTHGATGDRKQEAMLPKYFEAVGDIESLGPAPPYKQECDSEGTQTAGRRVKNTRLVNALHFSVYILVVVLIQAGFIWKAVESRSTTTTIQ